MANKGVSFLANMSIPLWAPEVPQGSYQKLSLFQSLDEAPWTGITLFSGKINPIPNIARNVIVVFLTYSILLIGFITPGPAERRSRFRCALLGTPSMGMN